MWLKYVQEQDCTRRNQGVWKRCTACLTPHQQSQSGLGVTCQVCVLDSALGLLGCCEVAANACLGAGGMSTHLLQLGCCSCLLSSPPRQKSSLAKKFGMITVPKGRLELQGASHRCLKKMQLWSGTCFGCDVFWVLWNRWHHLAGQEVPRQQSCCQQWWWWNGRDWGATVVAMEWQRLRSSGGDGMAEFGEQQWCSGRYWGAVMVMEWQSLGCSSSCCAGTRGVCTGLDDPAWNGAGREAQALPGCLICLPGFPCLVSFVFLAGRPWLELQMVTGSREVWAGQGLEVTGSQAATHTELLQDWFTACMAILQHTETCDVALYAIKI